MGGGFGGFAGGPPWPPGDAAAAAAGGGGGFAGGVLGGPSEPTCTPTELEEAEDEVEDVTACEGTLIGPELVIPSGPLTSTMLEKDTLRVRG